MHRRGGGSDRSRHLLNSVEVVSWRLRRTSRAGDKQGKGCGLMQLQANCVNGGAGAFNVTVADIGACPLCHHAIEALQWGTVAYAVGPTSNVGGIQPIDLQIVLRCPRVACHRLFIARYNRASTTDKSPTDLGYWDLAEIEPRAHEVKRFPAEVPTLSARFIEIFEQAAAAEDDGLDQICGPGSRKAMEFLIKDFLKSLTTDAARQAPLEKTQLAACIANYVDDPRLKTDRKSTRLNSSHA